MTSAAVPAPERLRIEVQGAVQGVGFRPFVYRLATELGLAGWVINDTRGVFIEVEGPRAVLEHFLARLPAESPPRAQIQSLTHTWLSPAGYAGFEIRASAESGARIALVLPDIATCPACLAEVFNPADRRHRYPFTNCTNCGPRFSIIQALPYDRPNTTMSRFTMCPACQREYTNPLDRRFHAQPNACPICGPTLALYEKSPGDNEARSVSATAMPQPDRWRVTCEGDEALRRAAAALRAGHIVAVKGLGGFHLMVDARNGPAIQRLRERKPRRDKPFALMARDLDQARAICEVSPEAEALLTAPEAPIVLLRRRRPAGEADSTATVAEQVAPGNPYLGVMLPYTPLHHLLLAELDFPVVATSGNLTDEPICTDEVEALQRLGGIAELFLVHNRPIARHVDDSVAWLVAGSPRLLRRARGYAPLPVLLRQPVPTILAVGAHLKNTISLSVGRQVFISQHIGDLETPEALAAFQRVIADFLRLYEARPVAIAHDLHPDYLSTRWAQEQGWQGAGGQRPGEEKDGRDGQVTLIGVQHHHAHLAACLAENHAQGPALGVTWDGTGYGSDGTVWGGEFLVGDARGFLRAAHLRPFRLPGGDAAVQAPWRVALALLWETYGEAAFAWQELALLAGRRAAERTLIAQMLARGVNSPLTTSAGRLFDGISALIGLRQEITFEGQAAMALEFAADQDEDGAYPMAISKAEASEPSQEAGPGPSGYAGHAGEPPLILDWRPLVAAVVDDLRRGTAPGIMAARFHNGLVEAILRVARAIGLPQVALTGGCFQNRLLTERAYQRLTQAGFKVLLHRQVPPNDGGISLGQVVVAAARLTT